jgi:CMP-N-acetylneuraminic acid synthetase
LKTFAFVFARGGSKGVPGKNIRRFSGQPLLAYALDIAKKIHEVSSIFVSTEDLQIAKIARKWGAVVIDRPVELAQDESSEWLAWQHAVDWVKEHHGDFERFVSLPATSPLRNENDVQACLNALDDETDMVITTTETNRSPWFNMVRVGEDNHISLLFEGDKKFVRRQDVPKAYDMTTVAYVTRPSFIMLESGVLNGRTKAVMIPTERAIDIDTEFDWEIAEYLMDKQNI